MNTTDGIMLSLLATLIGLSLLAGKPAPVDTAPVAETVRAPAPTAVTTRPAARTATVDTGELPDFAAIQDVQAKKMAFFNFMLPEVREANDRIRAKRRYLLQIRDNIRSGAQLSPDDLDTLAALARSYRVQGSSERELVNNLLLRVDVVPESLVLAQAANESGWGTSRFARQANNLFGVWCFTPGCGLEPLARDEGLRHEVASYDSVQAGIEAYLHTLNTNAAYVELRHIRAGSRQEAEYISGLAMAEGLLRYSARGADYVREIQAMIRVNNLQRYNLPIQV